MIVVYSYAVVSSGNVTHVTNVADFAVGATVGSAEGVVVGSSSDAALGEITLNVVRTNAHLPY